MPQARYSLLPEFDNSQDPTYKEKERRPARPPVRLALVCSVILNALLAYMYTQAVYGDGQPGMLARRVYSPAHNAIEYDVVKFTRGFNDDIPLYEQPPSKAVDEAWAALWLPNEVKISSSEAAKLTNETWPILSDPGHHIVSLEIFHQLHCLDVLRQRIHPGNNYTELSLDHLRHCVGVIRQGLMCAADVTPVVLQWSEAQQTAVQRDDVVHVCRKFDRIREWASANLLDSEVDLTTPPSARA
ncbi:hypothetical protein MKEN_00130700 [Mycena kentingensis (nom. inval.)]|nr:hypothetical protein MKEN_00130700 [Mycena kentingensis (nom. inval.)]